MITGRSGRGGGGGGVGVIGGDGIGSVGGGGGGGVGGGGGGGVGGGGGGGVGVRGGRRGSVGRGSGVGGGDRIGSVGRGRGVGGGDRIGRGGGVGREGGGEIGRGGGGGREGGELSIYIPSTANTHRTRLEFHLFQFHDYSRILPFMFTGTLMVIYIPLVSLVQLMFQNEGQSPFRTHGPFMITSVVALIIATITAGLLFYINDNVESHIREHVRLIHYMILKTTFCFSGILAPLSLLLVIHPRSQPPLDWVLGHLRVLRSCACL
ncbi:hypothetical protein L1987_13678 [Smallanthus sonchifolius]|uniref:Uncharacterized protein n=1 Tax=Smallanthus sonchifolius TaxID=185202 RepID=A0ACB9JJF5_9ASTR|nr:hypothetical protein L1987_13678 [Smallanthus sonchifolius]